MLFRSKKKMSRLKKKLLLYFLLIAIVSISVSAEIILELSSSRFTHQIEENIYSKFEKSMSPDALMHFRAAMKRNDLLGPLYDLRNRMILLLIVISVCIIVAFFMFTKDIVLPMDNMVEATKKIADGDLTVIVPVITQDEIGQVGGLINNMNTNLQDMVMQIRQEINRHMEQILKASYKLGETVKSDAQNNVLLKKKIRSSDYKRMVQSNRDVVKILENMNDDLNALQKFVNMYKTYQIKSEITEHEIEQAISDLKKLNESRKPG